MKENDKKKGIYSFYKGKFALEKDDFKNALQFFSRSLKIQPNYSRAVVAIGLLYGRQGKHDKVMSLYRRFLKKYPESPLVLSQYVELKFIAQSFSGLILLVEKLLEFESDNIELRARLGVLYSKKKQFSNAKNEFKRVLRAMPNSDQIIYYLGDLYRETQHYQQAIAFFKRIKEESAFFNDANIQIAQVLQIMGLNNVYVGDRSRSIASIAKAKQDLVRFVNETVGKNEELSFELFLILAVYYENVGELELAIDNVKILKEMKLYTEGHEYYLASLYEKKGDYKTAYQLIYRLLDENPNNAHALNFLGYSFLESKKDPQQAYPLIQKAIKIMPNDGYILDTLGWYFYRTQNYKKALNKLLKAWKLVQNDPVVAKHLAMVYGEMGMYAEAKYYYREALKYCKYQSEKQEIHQLIKDIGEKQEASRGYSPRLPASKL